MNKRVDEFEFSSWKSTAESSIYFAIFNDIGSKLLEEIEHLRAELGIEVCIHVSSFVPDYLTLIGIIDGHLCCLEEAVG